MKPDFQNVRREIAKLAPFILHVNRRIFETPETNFQEIKSSEFLASELQKHGFSVTRGKGKLKTAFEAVWRGKRKKPTIAILAEYDALPGIGHACGHNMIAALSLGAALAVKNIAGKECGTLKVIGTPAEEGGGGKLLMIKEGWFNGVDAAMMAHPSNKTRVVARMLAIMEIEFHFFGKASHAAAHPERGINALDGVINLFNAVNAMRQQTPDFSRVHGIITHGGDAPNVIPEFASAKFMVRGLTMPDFEFMIEKLRRCAVGAAKATGCRLKIKANPLAYHPFEPNRTMGKIFAENLSMAGLKESGIGETEEIGSSDIGNLSQVLPALHPEFAVSDGEAVNHSREFLKAVLSKKGTGNMLKVATALAATVLNLLGNPGLVKEVKSEFLRLKKS